MRSGKGDEQRGEWRLNRAEWILSLTLLRIGAFRRRDQSRIARLRVCRSGRQLAHGSHVDGLRQIVGERAKFDGHFNPRERQPGFQRFKSQAARRRLAPGVAVTSCPSRRCSTRSTLLAWNRQTLQAPPGGTAVLAIMSIVIRALLFCGQKAPSGLWATHKPPWNSRNPRKSGSRGAGKIRKVAADSPDAQRDAGKRLPACSAFIDAAKAERNPP